MNMLIDHLLAVVSLTMNSSLTTQTLGVHCLSQSFSLSNTLSILYYLYVDHPFWGVFEHHVSVDYSHTSPSW